MKNTGSLLVDLRELKRKYTKFVQGKTLAQRHWNIGKKNKIDLTSNI